MVIKMSRIELKILIILLILSIFLTISILSIEYTLTEFLLNLSIFILSIYLFIYIILHLNLSIPFTFFLKLHTSIKELKNGIVYGVTISVFSGVVDSISFLFLNERSILLVLISSIILFILAYTLSRVKLRKKEVFTVVLSISTILFLMFYVIGYINEENITDLDNILSTFDGV